MQIIGLIMLLMIPLSLFIIVAMIDGFKTALMAFGCSAFVLGWIRLAVYFLNGGNANG